MTGLQGEIRARILGATAHVSVFRAGNEPLEDYREVVAQLRAACRGVLGAAPAVYGKGLLTSADGLRPWRPSRASCPARSSTVTELATQIEDGQPRGPRGGRARACRPILLGRDLAAAPRRRARATCVTVTSPQGRLTPMGVLPRVAQVPGGGDGAERPLRVRLGLGLPAPRRRPSASSTSATRASLVEVRVDDMYAVRATAARRSASALGDGYVTNDWIQMNQSLFSALWLEKTAIAHHHRPHRDGGRPQHRGHPDPDGDGEAQGHRDPGLHGGLARGDHAHLHAAGHGHRRGGHPRRGALLGWGACQVLDRYQLHPGPEDVYQVSYVPFHLLPGDAAARDRRARSLICFLATIHPARGAARLDPAEALRYE